MNYILSWDITAIDSYIDECEFILLKWNIIEVEKFKIIVEENLERLSKNPRTGIYNINYQVYSLVISKQTTLYYSINDDIMKIELHLFWNNQKNPDELKKLL